MAAWNGSVALNVRRTFTLETSTRCVRPSAPSTYNSCRARLHRRIAPPRPFHIRFTNGFGGYVPEAARRPSPPWVDLEHCGLRLAHQPLARTTLARKVLGWPKRCSWAMRCCGNTARKSCSWPNLWANLASFSLFVHVADLEPHPSIQRPLACTTGAEGVRPFSRRPLLFIQDYNRNSSSRKQSGRHCPAGRLLYGA